MEGTVFSLILATYGRYEEIKNFFDSLCSCSYDLKKVQVIVVDQNTTIDITGIIYIYRKHIDITYVKLDKRGLSLSRNEGLKYVKGSIVAFPDDDCMYDRSTLSIVENYFAEHYNVEMVLGKVITPVGNDSIRKWPKRKMKLNRWNFYTKCSSITIFKRVRFSPHFNERLGVGTYFGSCEDADIVYRCIKEKKSVAYIDKIKIIHNDININTFTINKINSYGLGFGGFCRENMDMAIFILFATSVAFHLIMMFFDLVSMNKEHRERRYVSAISRIKGFKEFKKSTHS